MLDIKIRLKMTNTTTINANETPIMPEVENEAVVEGISVASVCCEEEV